MKCSDCGIKEAIYDELCEECFNDHQELNATIYRIPWQKYDPENPPQINRLYLVHSNDGRYPRTAKLEDDNGRILFWTEHGYVANNVTHYAPINLPREDETT